jgi:DNA-binding NarL/FixJ family response regulator
MKQIKVILADDHTIVREGFRTILALEKDIQIIGEAANGREAIILFKKLKPDILIIDIAMPLLNGLEATRQIYKEFPKARVLMLSAHSDDAYVEAALQAASASVCQSVRDIYNGKTCIQPSITRHFSQCKPTNGSKTALTIREMEILQMIAEGRPNKEIAAELNISIKTVEKHREHLMHKLNIHDTAGLTRYAISAGIIENSVQLTCQP